MNRYAISRLVEVSLLAGIAIPLFGAGSGLAQEGTGAAPNRQKVATQKLMRNPWEKTVKAASIQSGLGERRLYFYW